jgi:hypothetical protein
VSRSSIESSQRTRSMLNRLYVLFYRKLIRR